MSTRNQIIYSQWTFQDEDIQSGNIYVSMSLMSDALEANTFSATVECADSSIIDFERNTPLTYTYKGRQVGIFYVQSITRDGPTTYTISATSAIGLLIEGLHYGGIYTGQTVAEVLPSICGTVPYVVKTNLRDIALYGWLPVASPRDNLSQVLFAIGASLKTDLDGVLHIESLWDGISGTFSRDRMYQGASVDYEAKVTQVVVTEHQYIQGGEEKDLFDGAAQEGDIITFDEPMYNLQATGFTILESGANYAKVSSGSGTLKGNAYIHNTRQISQDVLTANEPNVVTVTDATLVSLVNSMAVTQRVANYYKSFQTINADAAYEGEAPGNLLSAWHPYDREAVSACLESADIALSKTLKATEELLVGFSPPQIQETIIFENRVVLTGEGDWQVPLGAVDVIAVLIDGGANGQPGNDGSAGSISRSDTDSAGDRQTLQPGSRFTVSASASSGGGTAGEGGKGGAGGAGGRVLRVSVDVSGLTSIHYKCGAAAGYGESTVTTFGEYSSEAGARSEIGYTDPITGELYAMPGADGEDGGDGGSPGQSGGSTSSASGGAGLNGGTANRSDSDYQNPTGDIWLDFDASATFRLGDGGGGGAGGGGSNGEAASGAQSPTCSMNFGTASATGYGIKGGRGGNGGNGKNGSNYGCGGDGGGGGGGAGASGTISTSLTAEASNSSISEGSYTLSLGANAYSITNMQYSGTGGENGVGVAGCIIVYYGIPEMIAHGPLVDSNNKYLLDKYGRRLVV